MFWNVILPEGQGSLYEAWGTIVTAKYSRMDVGQQKHGLHRGLTNDGLQV
jgi:hypothetical protein